MTTYDVRTFGAIAGDGIDDTFAIQAALDAAKLAGGGKVYIPAGTFIISGTGEASDGALRVHSMTELTGAGMGTTILKLADGYADKITGLIRTPVNEVTTDVIIRDLTLDGNRANTTGEVDGIMTGVLPGSALQDSRILIERVEIHDVSRIAFNPHEQTTNLIIRDSVAHHNSWDGFIADFVSNAIYENNLAYSNDRHGFNVVTHSHDMVLRNNIAYGNGEAGIMVQRGNGSTTIPGWEDMLNTRILISNNEVYGNGSYGITLKQTEDSQIVNNLIYDNLKGGIVLEGSQNNWIAGNTIESLAVGIQIKKYSSSIPGLKISSGNVVYDNIISAVNESLKEGDVSTTLNIYSDNDILRGSIRINPTSLIGTGLVLTPEQELAITALLPAIYGPPVHTSGGAGNDTLYGEQGIADTLDGAAGSDTANYSYHSGAVVANLQNLSVTDSQGFKDKLVSVENMIGTDFADQITGDVNGNVIWGGNGADQIKGAGGSDVIHAGLGDDYYVYGQDGDDLIWGNEGHDRLIGGAGADTLYGGVCNDLLYGDDGDDRLMGEDGTDRLTGGRGNDELNGGAGDDILVAEDGNDRLVGGAGVDTLYGQLGADIFVFDASSVGSTDTVRDFSLAQSDRLEFSEILIGFDALADLISEFITASSTTKATTVFVDRDGAGTGHSAQAIATLSGMTSFNVSQLYEDGFITVS